MDAGSMRILGFLAMLGAGTLMGIWTVGYGQPYEPEHLWGRAGEEPEDHFGAIVAGIGDVNGDGCEDLITGDVEPVSRSMIFFGGDPPDTIPDMFFNNPYPYGYFGGSWNIGDVNGDSSDDIAMMGGYIQENIDRVFIYFGGELLDTIPDIVLSELTFSDLFGSNSVGIGDVNGDGYDDIAVCASNYDQVRGKVFVYFGGSPMDSIADWEREGSAQHVRFGQSIAGKGDLNGDGFDDFAIYEWTDYPQHPGTTYYVYLGGTELDTIPDITVHGEEYYPEVDISGPSSLILDLNGDDYSDLVIVAGRTTNAVVLYGGNPMDTQLDLILDGFDPDPDGWGMNVSPAGDVNADGYDDIIAGQYDSDFWAGGRVLVYLGSPWMDGHPDMIWVGSLQPWHGCGISLADCGDINGDGVDDIMFGSYHMDFNSEGRLDIWKGDSAFIVSVPEEPSSPVPQSFRLLPPYPNPFNSTVVIPFEMLPGFDNNVSLRIYNLLGQEVVNLSLETRRELQDTRKDLNEVLWTGVDNHGNQVGSGIYFVEIRSGDLHQAQKLVLLR